MKTFKQYLKEATVGSGDLYHSTHTNHLVDMLKDNAIRLTYSSAVEAEPMKEPKNPFFLSTSRTMFGKYRHSGDYKTDTFGGVVTINLSIDSLKRYGVKLSDFDYWGPSFNKLPNFKEEEEVRLFYSKDKLAPLNKFVDSIHIFVAGREYNHRPFDLRAIYEASKTVNVPIYYYENMQAFKSQRTQYAIKDVPAYIQGLTFDPSTAEYYGRSNEYTQQDREKGDTLITNLLKIYKGQYDPEDKEQYKLYRNLTAIDGPQIISSAFHNAFRAHPEQFPEWHREVLKSGSKNTKEFVNKIIDKVVKDRDNTR